MWCTRTRDYFHDTPRGVSGLLSLWSASFAFIYRCSPSCCPPSPPSPSTRGSVPLPSPPPPPVRRRAAPPKTDCCASSRSFLFFFNPNFLIQNWIRLLIRNCNRFERTTQWIYITFDFFFSWFLILRSSLLEKLNRVTITNASEKNLR